MILEKPEKYRAHNFYFPFLFAIRAASKWSERRNLFRFMPSSYHKNEYVENRKINTMERPPPPSPNHLPVVVL